MPDDIRTSPHRGGLRASDADRRLVEEVLNTAFVDGRLTKDELDERLGLVWQAKTFDELAPVTTDLVPGTPTPQYATPAVHHDAPLVDATGLTSGQDTISIVLGEQKRTTAWRMAPRTHVNLVLGEVVLDLNEAVLETNTPVINANIFLGELTIFVPAGVRVVNQINAVLAETNVKGVPNDGASITLTLTGTTILGEVSILGPDDNSFKSRRRRKRK